MLVTLTAHSFYFFQYLGVENSRLPFQMKVISSGFLLKWQKVKDMEEHQQKPVHADPAHFLWIRAVPVTFLIPISRNMLAQSPTSCPPKVRMRNKTVKVRFLLCIPGV